MQTYSTNEVSITRADPSRTRKSVLVMMLSLEDRARREDPKDGLVAHLFSRLAAILALEQAEQLAKRHRLAPTDAVEVEENALKRAAAQESRRLVWNRDRRLYELRHPPAAAATAATTTTAAAAASPSKRRQQALPLVGPDGIPLSPVRTSPFRTSSPGNLQITVSIPSSDSNPRRRPPAIVVTAPAAFNATDAAAADSALTPRTSTLPLTDTDAPLASLDFGSMALTLSPAMIFAAMPSLYAIDSLVAAILAVAVSDEATNAILAQMQPPPPPPPLQPSLDHRASTRRSFFKPHKRFTGKLITTIAEREDAAEESTLMSRIRTRQRSSAGAAADPGAGPETRRNKLGFLSWGRPKPDSDNKASRRKKKQIIVVEEFDLEHYGRYGPGSSREGEKLPGLMRVLLRFLFWSLNLAVHILTVLVKLIAWFLVNATRCLTSDRF